MVIITLNIKDADEAKVIEALSAAKGSGPPANVNPGQRRDWIKEVIRDRIVDLVRRHESTKAASQAAAAAAQSVETIIS